jgi:hypothetical protein
MPVNRWAVSEGGDQSVRRSENVSEERNDVRTLARLHASKNKTRKDKLCARYWICKRVTRDFNEAQ